MSIANSPLFKTAMFAEDPNWGRILCAIGNIESNVNDLSKIEIYIGNNLVFKNNSIYKNYSESKSKKYLKNKNLEINIKYNNGNKSIFDLIPQKRYNCEIEISILWVNNNNYGILLKLLNINDV